MKLIGYTLMFYATIGLVIMGAKEVKRFYQNKQIKRQRVLERLGG